MCGDFNKNGLWGLRDLVLFKFLRAIVFDIVEEVPKGVYFELLKSSLVHRKRKPRLRLCILVLVIIIY